MNPTGLFAGMAFNRSLYERLRDDDSAHMLEGYRKFLDFRLEFSEIKKMKIPKPEDLYDVLDKLERIKTYQTEHADIDKLCKLRKEKNEYEYQGCEYSVVMPRSSFDLCLEAISQGNCLMDYIDEHAYGYTTILFIRKNDSIDQSFVTVEVSNGRWILAVFGKFNALPKKEVYLFLEEYAQKVCLFYDAYALIAEHIEEMRDSSSKEELWNFAEDYRKRRSWSLYRAEHKDVEYVQLSIADVFRIFWTCWYVQYPWRMYFRIFWP